MQFVKWDKEYLKSIPSEHWKEISKEIMKRWKNGIEDFPIHGITKEEALLICKEYDKVAAQAKGKHPITSDQTEINEKNKKMQQEKNEVKKQHKETKLDDK